MLYLWSKHEKTESMETRVSIRRTRGMVKRAPQTAEELLTAFVMAQDVKPNSRESYRRTLRQFFNWVERHGYNLTQLTREDLLEYKADLLASGLTSLTVSAYITSLRKFYEWAEGMKYYPNIAKGVKLPRRKQQFKKQPLTTAQATQLLQYYQGRALRDFAIVNLLLRTGLRTIEVIRANVEDITYKGEKRVLLIQGKGRDEKDNFVELMDKTYIPIREYLATRTSVKGSEPLFISTSNNSRGQRLTTRSISYIAKEGLKGIGLNERSFTAHSLRHTMAVNILRAGGTLEQAQESLRHSNPATTQIYTATIKEERRLAHSGEALIDGLF